MSLVPTDNPRKIVHSPPPPAVEAPPPVASTVTITASFEDVRKALEYIPNPDLGYDAWFKVICAIHSATGGEGLPLAHEWSAKSPKHDPEFLDSEIWPYLRDRENGITARTLFSIAEANGMPQIDENDFDIVPPYVEPPPSPAKLFVVSDSRAGNFYSAEPPRPKFVVSGHLPVDVGVEPAVGGTGKTSRHQHEAVHIILGRDLYGYSVERPGPVIIFTSEDSRDTMLWRLHHIVRAMGLSDAECRRVADHFHIVDLSGTGERLVKVDRSGNLERTDLAERIVRSFASEQPALVEFDPLNLLGPGERFVNDGEGAVLDAGRFISRELNACVRFTTHVSKAVGRDGIIDAHSGRGGSALGDNARFVHNYVGHDKEHNTHKPPRSAEKAFNEARLYRLHVSKLSSAPRPLHPIWIERDGFAFIHHSGDAISREDVAARNAQQLLDFLRAKAEDGVQYTKRELEDGLTEYMSMNRSQLRVALKTLETDGALRDEELPPEKRKGARKTYLAVTPADLGVQK